MEPESLFPHKYKMDRFSNFVIEIGIEPSLLSNRCRIDNSLNFPMEGGISPETLLLDRSSSFKDFKNPISEGMEPESLFPHKAQKENLAFQIQQECNHQIDLQIEIRYEDLSAYQSQMECFL
uniref:Uncharacterized protein n=1 Tax=Manihot esculenta TaxID=3983 RepID=A0A2C9V1Q8_MANES